MLIQNRRTKILFILTNKLQDTTCGSPFSFEPYFDVFYFLARSNDISMKKMEEKYDDYKIIS